jgi:hypothetical protein
MTYRLYEHIRLGATLKPQSRGTLFGGGTCAIGAALDSIGLYGQGNYAITRERFPFYEVKVQLPCGRGNWWFRAGHTCQLLNDNYRWTREQIADWLEPIEKSWWAEREAKQSEPETEAVTV